MRTIRKNLLTICMIGLLLSNAAAQDIHFSQMKFAALSLNPALAGANYMMQASLVYKDQWRAIGTAYRTIYAGFDMRINEKKTKRGFWVGGLNFFSDRAGDSNMGVTYIALTGGYHLLLDKNSSVGASIQPSFAQRSVKYTELKWGDQYDGHNYNPVLSTGEGVGDNQFSIFDINAGVIYTYKTNERYITANDAFNMNIGISVFHITEPKYSFYSTSDEKLFRKYVLFANGMIGLFNSRISLVPGIYTLFQGPQKEILFGTYFRYKTQEKSVYTGAFKGGAIALGIFYRYKDATVIKALYEKGPLAIGLGYDINVSSLKDATNFNGGFEIMIRYVRPNPFGSSATRL